MPSVSAQQLLMMQVGNSAILFSMPNSARSPNTAQPFMLAGRLYARPGAGSDSIVMRNIEEQFSNRNRPFLLHMMIAMMLALSLCDLAAAVPLPQSRTTVIKTDAWYRIEYDGDPVGYEHMTSRQLPPDDRNPAAAPRVSRFRQTELQLKRFGRDLSVSATIKTLESQDGRLWEWSLRRTAGDGRQTERSGKWSPDRSSFEVIEKSQATRRSTHLAAISQPFSPLIAAWGPQLLADPKGRLTKSVLFPETSSVVGIHFARKPPHSLKLRTGRRINVTPLVFQPTTDPQMATTLYLNDQHQVVRSEQRLLGRPLTLELTDAATALAGGGIGSLDVDAQSLIPVNRQILNPATRPVTRLRIVAGSGGSVFIPDSDWQSVQSQPDGSSIVALTRPVPPRQDSDPVAVGTDREFLSPTVLLNFETDAVRIVALRAGGSSGRKYDECVRLTHYLSGHLKRSRFSTTLLPADQIAKSMRGDCTEHAILLAAIMRERKIPARVVTGLIYVERVSAFTAHMWTEALIDGVWFPFDSAAGAGNTGADRIKLSESSMDFAPSGGVALFLPLLPLLGETRIELLSDRP
jgi:Transglutaminase-like superfamily